MSFDVKKARQLTNADTRTIKEKFIDEILYYVQMAAKNGEREITYRIPERFSDRFLVWEVSDYISGVLGYEVWCNYPDYPEMIVKW